MTSIAIPAAPGVPGFYNQAPNWWDTTQTTPPQWNTLDTTGVPDDPRWNGALRLNWNAGTLDVAVLRAIHDTAALYFSFVVTADPSLEENQDGFYFGLQGPGSPPFSAPAYVFQIVAFSSDSANLTDQPFPLPTMWTDAGGTWTQAAQPPAWLNPASQAQPSTPVPRSWLTLSGPTSTNNQWAVNVRVPLILSEGVPEQTIDDTGIYLGYPITDLTFQFWCEFNVVMPSGVSPFAMPDGVEVTTDQTTLQNVFPDPSTWATATTGAGTTGGISFGAADIGCNYNATDSTEIGASLTADTVNPLYVRFDNTGTPVVAGAIDASFRLANYGTQGLFSESAGSWQEIDAASPPKTNASPVPTGGTGAIDYSWTLPKAGPVVPNATQYLGASAIYDSNDNCMLVTLSEDPSSSQSPPLVFLNDTAYNNMHISDASVVEQKVGFDVRGLEAYAVGNHVSVYVYEERNNLPTDIPGGTTSSATEFNRIFGIGGQPVDIAAAVPRATVSWEDAATMVPTLAYHVFVGTNQKVQVGNQALEILKPMTSFGTFIRHDGPLYGWDVNLSLAGLTELAPNWYRVSVPKGGKLVGTTQVRAWETKRPTSGCLPGILDFFEKLIAAIRNLFK